MFTSSCVSQQCHRKEETKVGMERRYDDYYGYRNVPISEVISEEFICEDITFPLSFNNHCDNNCKSTLIVSSLSNTSIPSLSFSEINYLNVIHMKGLGIQDILPAAFNSLSQLKELYLSRNEISRIFDGLFSSLTSLETLDISRNKLESLTQHSLIGLKNLQLLNMSCNELINFDINYLDTLKKIQIDVSFNKLTTFDFKTSISIKNLILSHNSISVISGSFCSIERVKLNYNKLKTMGITCSDNSSTTFELDLSNNFFTDLPKGSFDSLHALQLLYLDHNNISYLQTDIFGSLLSLKSLNLSSNHLKEFQHGIFEHVQNLESLDLSNNNFTYLKRYFHPLSKLKRLDFSDNHVDFLDLLQMITDLPKLDQISLDGNSFSCENLVTIVQQLKKRGVLFVPGAVKSHSNVNGIACNESKSDSEVVTSISKSDEENKDKNEKVLKSMCSFFDTDFRESNFFKYLDTVRTCEPTVCNMTEIVSYMDKIYENTFLEIRNQVGFFKNSGDDLENSTSKNLQQLNDILFEGFVNSSFYNFFNNGFEKTRFYQHLENSFSTKSYNYVTKDEPKFEKIVNTSNVGESKNQYHGILVVIAFLQAIIALVGVTLIIVSVKLYCVLTKNSIRTKEQMELISS